MYASKVYIFPDPVTRIRCHISADPGIVGEESDTRRILLFVAPGLVVEGRVDEEKAVSKDSADGLPVGTTVRSLQSGGVIHRDKMRSSANEVPGEILLAV